jgi:parvulin-like peptidyl-prolyl isomerase
MSIEQTGARQPRKARSAVSKPAQAEKPPILNKTAILLIIISLLLGLVIGAWGMRTRYQQREKEVVVSVNGQNITKNMFYRRLELAAGPDVIRAMVREQLILQFARENQMLPTKEEIEKRYAELSKEPGFAQNLAQTGQTPEEFKNGLRVRLAQAAVINKGVTVTDEEIQKYYQRNIDPKNPQAAFYTPEMAQVAVIVTAKEEDAKKALEDIGNGLSFDKVAEKHSVDISKKNGGMMPPVYRGRSNLTKVPGMEDAIFRMKIGEQVGPVKYANAWWIIRCLDKKAAETKSLEKVREEARLGATLEKGLPANAESVEKRFEEYQNKAKVQAFWPHYREIVKIK